MHNLLPKSVQFIRKMSTSSFKIAGCQLAVVSDKAKNLENARNMIQKAKEAGASVVQLPECFNCPYGNKFFPEYAEEIPQDINAVDPASHPTTAMLSKAAQEFKVYLVGGSFPEREGDKLYNTCLCFSPDGKLVAKHRKVHLFDIDVPGKITFKESDTLSPGNSITTFDTDFCKIGVGICYDIRFPEMAMKMVRQGCHLLCYPGAFNMTTGPAHWELLVRSRAVDNQCYVSLVSPARDPSAGYVAWGHSTVTGPWGDILATTEHEQDLIIANIDLDRLQEVRNSIPVSFQRRTDLYQLS
eukprot:TRINITY_DN1548_c0_g1::TRINITY_DN1548_c0_g1_i1::g.28296::m.28296 TRINITY_DN1548_c0_g1::TRINITY_DN1548_c0_g1_i1::g.28296  ORF type:complete len:299 (-),score=49.42,sp/Q2T9R6/NIT2_BOVIN/56.79/2e-120,CN_hydrolase/PF00795.17/5.8e-36 TRINITY_DN1548_c0_g1_i1:69-965(-)